MFSPLKISATALGAAALSLMLLTPVSVYAQGGPGGADGPPPANVRIDVVTEEMMAPHLDIPGTIISRNDSRIASEISGRVDWVAEIGTLVEEGEPVVRLDRRMLDLRLQETEASVASLEASLRYQRSEVRRLREQVS